MQLVQFYTMLFQAVVIFLPILNFFKFDVKGERSIQSHNGDFSTISIYSWQTIFSLSFDTKKMIRSYSFII